jgi:hypothetical protein
MLLFDLCGRSFVIECVAGNLLVVGLTEIRTEADNWTRGCDHILRTDDVDGLIAQLRKDMSDGKDWGNGGDRVEGRKTQQGST